MRSYRQLLDGQPHNAVNKWSHYPEIYDEIFERHRARCTSVLEIGVQNGGSLQLLGQTFPNAQVHGLDIDPVCATLNGTLGDRAMVHIGDAADPRVLERLPMFDVIIDDASHIPQMQAVTFAYLFQNRLSDHGIYVIEDLEHSYLDWWRSQPWFALGNFFDFVRARIDDMHRVYVGRTSASLALYSLRIRKIEVYHGVVVFHRSESLGIPEDRWWEGPRIVDP
jgi:hypothetical protein